LPLARFPGLAGEAAQAALPRAREASEQAGEALALPLARFPGLAGEAAQAALPRPGRLQSKLARLWPCHLLAFLVSLARLLRQPCHGPGRLQSKLARLWPCHLLAFLVPGYPKEEGLLDFLGRLSPADSSGQISGLAPTLFLAQNASPRDANIGKMISESSSIR
jgi:hypothetical protein